MVNEENESGKDIKSKVAWNLSEAVTVELGELLKEASRTYFTGRLHNWYIILRAIKMRITPKLTKDERQDLLNLEFKIKLCRTNRKLRKRLGYFIERYNEMILDLLEDKGFYPQDKEDRSKIN